MSFELIIIYAEARKKQLASMPDHPSRHGNAALEELDRIIVLCKALIGPDDLRHIIETFKTK